MRQRIAAAFFLLGCTPVWAHGELGGGKGLLSGLAHFFSSALSLAAVVGLLAVIYVVDEKKVPGIVIGAVVAAALSSFLAGSSPAYLAPLTVALIGITAVLDVKLSGRAAVLLAILAGLASGVAADLEPPTLARAAGVAIALAGLLGSALYTFPALDKVRKLQTVLPIARRVLGSWVAAIGLLMAALAWHQTKGL